MKLYLVQHGKAKSKEEDPERGLTPDGIRESEKTASFLSSHHLTVVNIFHSEKLRAGETARIFGKSLNASMDVKQAEGLAPDDDPFLWYERLNRGDEDAMLVGHLPHLSRLASLLLCGDIDREIVRFSNSGVVCLEKNEDKWSLRWMIVPQVIL